VREMIEPSSPRGPGGVGLRRRRGVGRRGRGRLRIGDELGDVEEMTLAGVVRETFTALAEDVTAKHRQGLGQLGMFFLQVAILRRGLFEHAFELIDAALCGFDLLLSDLGSLTGILSLLLGALGLLPQLGVAAKQVLEQPLAFTGIVREE
jgi:hypothetical protein